MKEDILNTVDDLVSSFLYYDRKEDEDLGVGDIEDAITKGIISIDDITDRFKKSILNYIK